MIDLDLRTVYFNSLLFFFVSAIVIFILWWQTRKRFDGVQFFVLYIVLFLFGDGLISLRGYIPDVLSIVVSNSLIILGASLSYIGLERFYKQKSSILKHIILLACFVPVQYYFCSIYPDLNIRIINVSVGIAVITGLLVWLSLIKLRNIDDPILKAYGIANMLFFGISIFRIYRTIYHPQIIPDYFNPKTTDLFIVLSFHVLFLLISFFLILIINNRLIREIKSQEDKFNKAFHYAPFSMCVTRISDGKILEVNEFFEKLHGYTMAELDGQLISDVNMWLSECDRTSFMQALENGQTKSLQYQFKRKNGDIFLGELSAQTFMYNHEECLISVINDITEKTKADKLINDSQLMLKKFAAQLQSAVEEEKVLLANQIDNELNQNLAALKLELGHFKNQLNAGQSNNGPTEISVKIDDIYSILGNSLKSSLKIMSSLRNEVLHIMGFMGAVELYVDEFSKKNQIKCDIETNISKYPLNPQQSTPLFRVFENAMSNIAEHSKATEAKVRINTVDNTLRLEIVDNGIGFSYNQSMLFTCKGLMFMQERIHLLDGNMQIETASKQGTKIIIEIPVCA